MRGRCQNATEVPAQMLLDYPDWAAIRYTLCTPPAASAAGHGKPAYPTTTVGDPDRATLDGFVPEPIVMTSACVVHGALVGDFHKHVVHAGGDASAGTDEQFIGVGAGADGELGVVGAGG